MSVFALEKSQEKELIKENISKNKKIESETKTSIGDLIQEELNDSSKDWMKKSDFISSLYNNLEDYSEMDINLSANLIEKIIKFWKVKQFLPAV